MQSVVKRNRKLENEEDLFSQNAWDDAEWTCEMLKEAEEKINQQRYESERLGVDADTIENNVSERWNDFYTTHGDKFFKDRKWLFSEFPEIISYLKVDSGPCSIFEVGCGVGNAVAYIVDSNTNPDLKIFCCDLSSSAIETLKKRKFYLQTSDIIAFQADIRLDFDSIVSRTVPKDSVDFITLIFTLSALKPEVMQTVIANLATLLKPEGLILFRDYAQNDLTQLRFKGKSYIKDNYYVRADGTTSYFFSEGFVDNLFRSAGLVQEELKLDNRILVNRLKAIKMCRCWIQAKYRKVN